MKNNMECIFITFDKLKSFIESEIIKNKKENIKVDFDNLLYLEPTKLQYEIAWGCVLNNTLIGYITINRNNVQHCEKLYISPRHRNIGVGKFLLNEMCINSVFVLEDNKEALAFYTKCGFFKKKKQYKMLVLERNTNTSLESIIVPNWIQW